MKNLYSIRSNFYARTETMANQLYAGDLLFSFPLGNDFMTQISSWVTFFFKKVFFRERLSLFLLPHNQR